MDVIVADPDDDERETTASGLSGPELSVTAVGSLSAALDEVDCDPAEGECIDGVVTEYQLPDGNGLELLERVRSVAPDAVCVLYTHDEFEDIDTASHDVVAEFVSKESSKAHAELAELVSHRAEMQTHAAYPLPDDEAGRVAALEQYVTDDDALVTALDRLTELAAGYFEVDSTSVALVESHHEQFLSCQGTNHDTIDREETVCTYAILGDGVTVVEDLSSDPRFESEDWARETETVFYAGAPLVTEAGHAIGVFCLYHDETRTLSDSQCEMLELFAEEAQNQLDLRRRLRTAGGERDD